MQHNTDQYLDKLTEKIMKASALESPSLDFTATIMSQVETIKISSVTVYKPLISKRTWFIIGLGILSVFAYIIFGMSLEETSWFDAITIDYSFISDNKLIDALSNIVLSKTLIYAIVFFAALFFIQVTVLKDYFSKRLEY